MIFHDFGQVVSNSPSPTSLCQTSSPASCRSSFSFTHLGHWTQLVSWRIRGSPQKLWSGLGIKPDSPTKLLDVETLRITQFLVTLVTGCLMILTNFNYLKMKTKHLRLKKKSSLAAMRLAYHQTEFGLAAIQRLERNSMVDQSQGESWLAAPKGLSIHWDRSKWSSFSAENWRSIHSHIVT